MSGVSSRRRLADRAARRAKLAAIRNAAAMGAGDGGVFAQIDAWRKEAARA